MKHYITIIALLLSVFCATATPPRVSYKLNDGWEFFYTRAYDSDNAKYINLPHTWNSDASTLSDDYLRTSASYVRQLYIPSSMYGKRIFLRFGAAQSVATLFVNGRYVGEHRGGYTAFTYEITDMVRYDSDNVISVVVANGFRSDVLPTSTDQNVYGGIYRDVELIVTEKSVISPVYYSTDGVFVVQHDVSNERVKGVVRVCVSAYDHERHSLRVRMVDDAGRVAFERTSRISKIADDGSVDIPYEIESPKLWSPASPSMYSVEVELLDDTKLCDRVVVDTGFRKISISDNNRLCINDEPVEVRGVNYAHDRYGVGAVFGSSYIDQDLDMMSDMGVNAVRSLTGPHGDYLYSRCDREGVLVWIDMPFTRSPLAWSDVCYYPMPGFRDNGMEQLREIIMQNYNHPSVVMWGLFSLVWQRGEDVTAYISALNDLSHTLDKSRLTVGCSNVDGAINYITDLIVLRQNVGWYKGRPEDSEVWCQQLGSNTMWSKLRFGVCYGEEGVMSQQVDDIVRAERGTRSLPERRQTIMHEVYSNAVRSSGIFWGVWLNSMFDYGSSRRVYGVNQSGMVDFEHRNRKDAYYLYRSLWNGDEHTLYVAERRWKYRRDTLQHIKVYASAGCPQVFVNGDTVAVRRASETLWVADSVVIHGTARVDVVDTLGVLTDRIDITTGSVRVRR